MPRVTVIQASDLNIYTIPPVWKRVAAETIDFLILIVLKVFPLPQLQCNYFQSCVGDDHIYCGWLLRTCWLGTVRPAPGYPEHSPWQGCGIILEKNYVALTHHILTPQLDVRLALQFTQEILVLELVHRSDDLGIWIEYELHFRMVVCLFEALCTHRFLFDYSDLWFPVSCSVISSIFSILLH